MEEPGRLQSMGSQRVRQTEVTEHALIHAQSGGDYSLPITLAVAACISSNPATFLQRRQHKWILYFTYVKKL